MEKRIPQTSTVEKFRAWEGEKYMQRIFPILEHFKAFEHYSLAAKLPILKPGLNEFYWRPSNPVILQTFA